MSKLIIGVIHLLPLPGTPHGHYTLDQVLHRAVSDAQSLKDGGVDTVILENFGDAPFVRTQVEPHVVAMMTRIALAVREVGLALGINVLRNDAQAAMAIASTVEAIFIRINVHTGAAWTDQGLIQGEAYQTLMYRKQLGVSIEIAADVMVKHATPAGTRTLLDAAKDTLNRGGAAHLIVTGTATGATVNVNELANLRASLPNTSIWIGSGIHIENVEEVLQFADGAIVGTYFHTEGDLDKPLDAERVAKLVHVVSEAYPQS